MLLTSVFPIVFLILAVLGSIFLGIAAPTEAAAVGAFVATLLALVRRGLTFKGFGRVALECAKVTGMIAVVAIGALSFTGVLLRLGGGQVVAEFIHKVLSNIDDENILHDVKQDVYTLSQKFPLYGIPA